MKCVIVHLWFRITISPYVKRTSDEEGLMRILLRPILSALWKVS